ncbi:hypothetical protein PR202_gb01064 [Eleusine coracana subsp. coracana]|uniref:DNA-directed RNA polymerase subunit n=1 Tax=Eleusine coracana subsp. coracana TaxID=191504 RepID=A0AAV5DT74_ELECO|nr:hypothetical protein PR202_gb01064 [Eleusine coracana subsp. coracana]
MMGLLFRVRRVEKSRKLRLTSPPAAAEESKRSKMFFHIVLERNMQLHPRHFGPHLRDKLVSKLIKDVEGTCSGRHGFVVAITGVEDIGKGLIREGTGFVTFPVKYQCVVFRPFKGEILEAVVTMVNKMGFFAEAGPVQIFVSNHLIPDDMEFQSGDVPNYTTSDGSVKIQKESEVRLKIIGTRVDATEIVASEVFGVSRGGKQEAKDTWWWNDKVQRAIKEKKECFKRLHLDKSATNIEGYKIAKRAAKRAVSVAKGQAYDNLYQRLGTKEGEKDIYRMARIRERKTRDINQIKCIKDGVDRLLTLCEKNSGDRDRGSFEEDERVVKRWALMFCIGTIKDDFLGVISDPGGAV